jgi:hypothetical protein
MPPIVVYVLTGAIAVLFLLHVLARRFPDIDWLQHLRIHRPYDAARDRHLDMAWMSAPDIKPVRNPFARTAAEVKKELSDFGAVLPQLPPERQSRLRRSRTVSDGVQLILLGIALPFADRILSMMLLFSDVGLVENVIVFTASGLCIVLGIVAILRSGKDR